MTCIARMFLRIGWSLLVHNQAHPKSRLLGILAACSHVQFASLYKTSFAYAVCEAMWEDPYIFSGSSAQAPRPTGSCLRTLTDLFTREFEILFQHNSSSFCQLICVARAVLRGPGELNDPANQVLCRSVVMYAGINALALCGASAGPALGTWQVRQPCHCVTTTPIPKP